MLGFRNKQLMEKVVAAVSKIVTELIPQEVANLAWCCGKIGFVDVVFLEAIARQSISIIHEFVTQDLCTVGRCPICLITIIKYHNALVREGSKSPVAVVFTSEHGENRFRGGSFRIWFVLYPSLEAAGCFDLFQMSSSSPTSKYSSV